MKAKKIEQSLSPQLSSMERDAPCKLLDRVHFDTDFALLDCRAVSGEEWTKLYGLASRFDWREPLSQRCIQLLWRKDNPDRYMLDLPKRR